MNPSAGRFPAFDPATAPPNKGEVTRWLLAGCDGDARALDALAPLVHDELHRQAARFFRRERPGHTLQPTVLVNEVYLRLINRNEVSWQNRAQFFGIAAESCGGFWSITRAAARP